MQYVVTYATGYIHSYLKPVLKYEFLFLDTGHLDTIFI